MAQRSREGKVEGLARDLEVASPDDPLSEIIDLMGRQQIRRIPVVDAYDKLVGIVSLADIANRADQHDDLQRAFEKSRGDGRSGVGSGADARWSRSDPNALESALTPRAAK